VLLAALLLARPGSTVLLAAAAASIVPLAVWLYSRTLGILYFDIGHCTIRVKMTDAMPELTD